MTTGKFERLLTMMAELQDRQIPVNRIAKDLAVTERTAYRYLKIFNDVGFCLRVLNNYSLKRQIVVNGRQTFI